MAASPSAGAFVGSAAGAHRSVANKHVASAWHRPTVAAMPYDHRHPASRGTLGHMLQQGRRARASTGSPPFELGVARARSSAPTAAPTASRCTTSPSARPDGRAGRARTPGFDDRRRTPTSAPVDRGRPGRRARVRRRTARAAAGPVLDALRAAADRGACVLSVCSGAFAARRGRPARRPPVHHPLAVRRRAGRAASRRPRSTRNVALRRRRQRAHQRRHRGGHRRLPAPGPRRSTARARGHRAGPADGRAAAPRRRSGAVHRGADARAPPRRRPWSRCSTWLMAQPRPAASPSTTLAARAHMAPRTFARRFRAETGTTPHDWLTNQRVLLARRLLEETDLGVDAIAARAGFGRRGHAAPPLHPAGGRHAAGLPGHLPGPRPAA